MNDRPEHPERRSSTSVLVEVAPLDLRYAGCRLQSPAAEARLLSAIAAGGIQEALPGVESGGVRILLHGFKRLRCARKLHLATGPFVALATDETAGIVFLLRAANDHALSLLEQARFLDELQGAGGLSVGEIAQQVGRSPAWVSLRLGGLAELSPLLRSALFDGSFPVYSYLYTLRPFRRLNGAAAVDEFVAALRGKKLSARQIEQLAPGFFRGPESLREQIRRGHLALPLQQLKELPEDPDGCSEFERGGVADLEQAQKVLIRLMTKSADPRRLSAKPSTNFMITADKRKAVFLLHQEGVPKRAIARQLRWSRNAVRHIIAQSGQMPPPIRPPRVVLDADRLRQLHQECEGHAQRMTEKLREEHGLTVKYSTLTRHLRDLGITGPSPARCQKVPDEPGAEMQHDTSPFTLLVGTQRLRLQASLLYRRYAKRRYWQFYPVFDRFHLKGFLHLALMHWGGAPPVCVIDNTNLARWRGLGANAVMVPEMEVFARGYGFKFLCHAPKHSDRKAGEERRFLTVETNFIPGRTFASLEDLNRQALAWSTVRMEQRPQGKAGLLPAQAFEHERQFLTPLPRPLPAPYQLLERSVDEYGYVAVDGNYYEVPGTGRGQVRVLRYLHHVVLCQDRRAVIEYPLLPWGVKNQLVPGPGQPARYQPRNRKLSSDDEEKRLRALAPEVAAYVDFILATPGLLRHQFLRRLWARHQRWGRALFGRTVERAHRYHITSLETIERIALRLLDDTALPEPLVDPDLEKHPAYQEGSRTDTPDLSRYDD